mmetsp:Transcript_17334/g.25021  ORF Transcript_17334/g.25021 Transcript_17334/m.25021 type:complete len:292 (-) Transcript_17334:965-1840(-)
MKHTRGASKFQTSLETFEEEDEDEDYDMDFQSIDPPILQCSASQSTSRSIGYQDVPLAHNSGQDTRGGIHTENDLFANSLSFHSVEPSTIIKRSSLRRDSADFLSNNNNPHHIHSIGTKIDEMSHHFNESDSYQLSNRVLQQTSLHPRPKGDVLPGLSEAASREFYLQFVNIERIERQSSFSSVSAGSSLKSHRSSSGGLPLKSSHGIAGTQSSTGDTGRDKIRFFNDGVEIDYYGKLLSFDEADQKIAKYRTVSPKLYEDNDSQDKFAGKMPQPSQMTAQRASFWEEIEC